MPRKLRVSFCHCCGAETQVKTVAGSDLCPQCEPLIRESAENLYGNKLAMPRVLESLYHAAA